MKTIAGDGTRPTTDRIKETLFNILQNDLDGIRFLDLFAGSGGIGIEALSRGADFACFVDQNRAAVDCIRENLRVTRLFDQAEVLSCDVRMALERLKGQLPFQIIFMDPPYGKGLEDLVLQFIAASRPSYVDAQTMFIVEMAMETDETHLAEYGYEIFRVKKYKTNKHIFLGPMIYEEERQEL